MRSASLVFPTALALLFSAAALSNAVTLDGQLDPEYGLPLVVQTTQTLSTDATAGRIGATNGGEIDAAYAIVADNTLHLFVTGNLRIEGNPVDYGAFYTVLHVFIDAGAGGQNVVDVGVWPYVPYLMGGMTFDAGVTPEYSFECVPDLANWYDPTSTYTLHAYLTTLAAGGGGTRVLLGNTGAGGPGTLVGGTNPQGVQLAIDNSNVAGVTSGCSASSGAGVTTGIEWAIPMSALGNPTGCLRVTALLTRAYSIVAQTLGPLPPDAFCDLVTPASTNFATVAGEQFFTFCPGATPTHTSTWGAIKSRYR